MEGREEADEGSAAESVERECCEHGGELHFAVGELFTGELAVPFEFGVNVRDWPHPLPPPDEFDVYDGCDER